MPLSAPRRLRPLLPWCFAGALFLSLLIVYGPALSGGILWDDPAHLTKPDLRGLHGLFRIWTELGATQQYYPVLHSAFWFEHLLFGDATLPYHLLNLAQHAAAATLFALLLARLRRPSDNSPAPWIAALLFALHPVCVESVAWITEQKNTLSLLLALLAAHAYLRFHDTRKPAAYALALLLFLLALGSKTVTATLPAALLVIFWWRDGRLAWRRDVAPLLPWFALGLAASLFTAWVERHYIGAHGSAFDLSPVERLLLASRNLWFYLGKLLRPSDLMFIYPRWDVAASTVAWTLCLLAALAVTAALWLLRHRTRGPLACWLLFGGMLFPALGFFNVYPFTFSFVADHFQYHASLAVFALAGAGLARVTTHPLPPLRHTARALLALTVILLGWLAHRETPAYRDETTLYRVTLAKNPAAWLASYNLANFLAEKPATYDEAIHRYLEALRHHPDFPSAHFNLANTLARLPGRQTEAIAHYRAALRLKPDFSDAHHNLADQLATLPGRQPEAIAHYEAAIRSKPGSADSHIRLAALLAARPGRQHEAVAHYETALALKPTHPEILSNLAALLTLMPGREADAIARCEEALRLNPNLSKTHNNLALLLARQPGRQGLAAAHYREAIRLDPAYVAAHFNYANLLASRPDTAADAVALYETVLRLDPAHAAAHHNLAVLLARDPARQHEARAHHEEALRLNPALGGPR